MSALCLRLAPALSCGPFAWDVSKKFPMMVKPKSPAEWRCPPYNACSYTALSIGNLMHYRDWVVDLIKVPCCKKSDLVHGMMVVFAVGRDNEQVCCHNNRIIFSTFSVNAQHGISVQNSDVNGSLSLGKVTGIKVDPDAGMSSSLVVYTANMNSWQVL